MTPACNQGFRYLCHGRKLQYLPHVADVEGKYFSLSWKVRYCLISVIDATLICPPLTSRSGAGSRPALFLKTLDLSAIVFQILIESVTACLEINGNTVIVSISSFESRLARIM